MMATIVQPAGFAKASAHQIARSTSEVIFYHVTIIDHRLMIIAQPILQLSPSSYSLLHLIIQY